MSQYVIRFIRCQLLGNLLTGKGGKKSKMPGQGVMRPGEGKIRAGQNF